MNENQTEVADDPGWGFSVGEINSCYEPPEFCDFCIDCVSPCSLLLQTLLPRRSLSFDSCTEPLCCGLHSGICDLYIVVNIHVCGGDSERSAGWGQAADKSGGPFAGRGFLHYYVWHVYSPCKFWKWLEQCVQREYTFSAKFRFGFFSVENTSSIVNFIFCVAFGNQLPALDFLRRGSPREVVGATQYICISMELEILYRSGPHQSVKNI